MSRIQEHKGPHEIDEWKIPDELMSMEKVRGSHYLAFQLSKQDFGVNILKVQEIKNYSSVTPIPNTPNHVRGAMNLRGTVVPIIDLRLVLGMPQANYDQYTVIVVVNVGTRVLGLIVDAVSDVLKVGEDEFEPAPDFGHDVDISFISGLAKSENRLVTLLDLDKMIGDEMAHPNSARNT